MRVERLRTLGFRNLADAEVELGSGATLLWGQNGAGKTNMLEALYMALAGRSCRTSADRETIAFGADLSRSEADVASADGQVRRFLCSVSAESGRRHLVDGTELAASASLRPAIAVFMPDRLVLIKGPPAARRSHLDSFAAALRPALAAVRSRYARALAQRNALLTRIRRGQAGAESLAAWDQELGDAGFELIEARAEICRDLGPPTTAAAADLGLDAGLAVSYRPRAGVASAAELASELERRRESDISRGFSGYGPHLDELAIELDGRALRRYGSQGQQRIGLLALLFGERELLAEAGRPATLMLLDDVTSELDRDRRERLCERLERTGGQALVTATSHDELPPGCERLEFHVEAGAVKIQG